MRKTKKNLAITLDLQAVKSKISLQMLLEEKEMEHLESSEIIIEDLKELEGMMTEEASEGKEKIEGIDDRGMTEEIEEKGIKEEIEMIEEIEIRGDKEETEIKEDLKDTEIIETIMIENSIEGPEGIEMKVIVPKDMKMIEMKGNHIGKVNSI